MTIFLFGLHTASKSSNDTNEYNINIEGATNWFLIMILALLLLLYFSSNWATYKINAKKEYSQYLQNVKKINNK